MLALGDERGVERAGIVGAEDAVEDLHADEADLAVEVSDLGFDGGALGGGLVGGGDKILESLGDEVLDVLRREELGLDVVEHRRVEAVHADREPGAGHLVLRARAADVVIVVFATGFSADGDFHAPAAGAAAEPWGEQSTLAEADGVVGALAFLALALFEGADRRRAGEVLVGDGRGVRVAADDLAVVDDVTGVGGAAQDLRDVLAPPGLLQAFSGDVLAARWGDAFEGEPLREALEAIAAFEVFGEDPLDGLEGGACLVGDLEAGASVAGHGLVAVRRVPVDPEAALGLKAHAALHVA